MIKQLISILRRNHYGMQQQKVLPRRVNLEYWQGAVNYGDTLAPVIHRWMLARKGLTEDTPVKNSCHLLEIGSVLAIEKFDAVVWGSGVLGPQRCISLSNQRFYRKYDIRAVRGPWTRQLLMCNGYDCPEVYGDPGVLMPLIYQPPQTTKKYPVTVVCHYQQDPPPLPEGCNLLSIRTDDYQSFIDTIAASEKVISSSLHGIIMAEAYGVPAVMLRSGMESFLFKFYDWYHSTGRYDVRIADSVEQAMKMEPMPLPELDTMRQTLLDTFPYDLWED